MRNVLASLGLLMTGCGLAPIETQERARFALPRDTADVPPSEPDGETWTTVSASSLPWLFEIGVDLAEAPGDGAFIAGSPYRGSPTTPHHDFGLLKIGGDGRPDASFGDGGLAISFADSSHGVARDVLVTADGEIVCGYVFDEAGTHFSLARLDPLGHPWGSRDGGNAEGETLVREQSACGALAAAPDNSYVAGGEIMTGHVFFRFHSDGSADPTFGDAGRTVVPSFIDGSCCVRDISIAEDGSIFVSTSPGGYVFKLTPEGMHDLTWGTNGYLDVSGGAESLQLDGNGIVIAGFQGYANNPFIERYFLDGSVDETFGDGGKITIDRFGEFRDTDRDGDGLIAVGRTDVGGLLLRIDASGQIDPEVGVRHFPLGTATEFNSVEVFSDGNIVMSGWNPLLFRILREPPSSESSD